MLPLSNLVYLCRDRISTGSSARDQKSERARHCDGVLSRLYTQCTICTQHSVGIGSRSGRQREPGDRALSDPNYEGTPTVEAALSPHFNRVAKDAIGGGDPDQFLGELQRGRVGMWRGGFRCGIAVSGPFGCRCPTSRAMPPFPHPSHRTRRALLRHRALGQVVMPSPTAGSV